MKYDDSDRREQPQNLDVDKHQFFIRTRRGRVPTSPERL
jgi:hypothetical protein